MQVVGDEAALRAVLGHPLPRVRDKARPSLHAMDRAWIAASPLCLLATCQADGGCDVTPRGDPPGSVLVLSDTTLAVAERPGNRRADALVNVLSNPHVGLLFVVPGRTDLLRVNGRAQVVADAAWFAELEVKGHRPALALHVEVQEVFSHCSKALLRAQVWETGTWAPQAVPSRPQIAHAVDRPDESLAALEAYYGAAYTADLY